MTPNIRITGPTPLAPRVREAAGRQVVSHRSDAFRGTVGRIVEGLRPLFGCAQDPLIMSCSGTGGLEAAIVNLVPRRGRVLAVSIGHFGDRFANLARRHGAEVTLLRSEPGDCADPDVVRSALARASAFDTVLLTHVETSMGVINPLAELASSVREHSDALLLLDAVSSAAATPIEMDANGIDVVVTASQKALMAPAGLCLIGLSERAVGRLEARTCTVDYLDLGRAHAAIRERTTTYTPAIAAIFGLEAALELIHAEGFTRVVERHRSLSHRCREGLAELGVELFAARDPAPTVTSFLVDKDASLLRQRLERECLTFVSQGRGPFKARMLRIGHMGWCELTEVEWMLASLAQVLRS